MTVAPFKFNSAFRIFMIIRKLWAPRFVISTGKVHVSIGHNTTGFLWTIHLYLPLDPYLKLTKKRTLKASFFSGKPLKLLETESFAEVQFVIDSCRFVSQSNYLSSSNKDCDWLILACFIREQYMLTPFLLIWKIKFGLKIQPNAWGNYLILYHKTNKEASTVLCFI